MKQHQSQQIFELQISNSQNLQKDKQNEFYFKNFYGGKKYIGENIFLLFVILMSEQKIEKDEKIQKFKKR